MYINTHFDIPSLDFVWNLSFFFVNFGKKCTIKTIYYGYG